jgi:hypothetical protein
VSVQKQQPSLATEPSLSRNSVTYSGPEPDKENRQMKLSENIMFVRLGFGLPRQSRKVKAEADVSPDRLRASAKLYSGKAFADVKSFDSATRAGLMGLAINIPSCFRGAYVLPAALVDRVTQYLRDAKAKREDLVNAFLRDSYAQERESARVALGDSFREGDFPDADVLRQSFRMEWSLFRLDVPDSLPSDVLEAEREKFENQMSTVADECRAALRETLADLVGHLADRLTPDADGNRKRLATTTVENLREFLDTVDARDITSDDAIRELSARARAVLGTNKADALKGKFTGDKVRAGLVQVKSDIDALIEREGGRKIDLDME